MQLKTISSYNQIITHIDSKQFSILSLNKGPKTRAHLQLVFTGRDKAVEWVMVPRLQQGPRAAPTTFKSVKIPTNVLKKWSAMKLPGFVSFK